MKRWGRTVAKWLFVVALCLFLGKKGFISIESLRSAFVDHTGRVALGYLAIWVAWAVATYRWYLLLTATSTRALRPGRILQIALIGNFFNIALPGAVSGDVVKAFYVAGETQERTARALSSIVMDRIVGLAALNWVAAAGVLSTLHWEWPGTVLSTLRGFTLGTAGIFVGFFIYLFTVRGKADWVRRMLDWGAQKHRFFGSFQQVYESIKSYDQYPSTVFRALLLSCVGHLSCILCCWSAAAALGDVGLPLRALIVLIPVGMLATAIPLTPAGVGTGHAAFLALFHLIGSERGADVFSIFVLGQLLIGLFGGVVYLLFKKPVSTTATGASRASELGLHDMPTGSSS